MKKTNKTKTVHKYIKWAVYAVVFVVGFPLLIIAFGRGVGMNDAGIIEVLTAISKSNVTPIFGLIVSINLAIFWHEALRFYVKHFVKVDVSNNEVSKLAKRSHPFMIGLSVLTVAYIVITRGWI